MWRPGSRGAGIHIAIGRACGAWDWGTLVSRNAGSSKGIATICSVRRMRWPCGMVAGSGGMMILARLWTWMWVHGAICHERHALRHGLLCGAVAAVEGNKALSVMAYAFSLGTGNAS